MLKTVNQNIINYCSQNSLTIATAESLTGGLVGASLVDISGASAVYKGTVTAYDLAIKENILNISKDVIKEDAVNSETAFLMAKNVSELMDSDIGVSTTGIAEMYDDRPKQAYICIYNRKDDSYKELHLVIDDSNYEFPLDRNTVREQVVEYVQAQVLCFLVPDLCE